MGKQDTPQPQPQRQDQYQYQLFLRLDNNERHFVEQHDGQPMIFEDQAEAIAEAGHIAGHCPDQVGIQVTIPMSLDLSSLIPQATVEIMN